MKHGSFLRIFIPALAIVAIISVVVPWYSHHLREKSLGKAERGFQVDALHAAERAVALNPLSVDALFVLAGANQRLGREEAAREALEKATGLQPLNYQTWEQLARYERDRWRQPEEARAHYERAIELNPLDKQLRESAGVP
jgi:tetratricopeptide (TPR) repeat protein